jgi:hypothetical protein
LIYDNNNNDDDDDDDDDVAGAVVQDLPTRAEQRGVMVKDDCYPSRFRQSNSVPFNFFACFYLLLSSVNCHLLIITC